MPDDVAALLAGHDIAHLRADNPGPLTLGGTNTWVAGRHPAWVVDPGPALPDHVDAVAREVEARGGLGGIALTHDHADHAEAVPALLEACAAGTCPATAAAHVHAARPPEGGVALRDGDAAGPLVAVATPGHSPDHLAFLLGPVAFTGDAVLGEGSVFVAPDPGALRGYLEALRALRARDLEALLPGHGPVVLDPAAKLDGYVAHRLERERRLLAALGEGRRTAGDLLDAAWSDVPPHLRTAAAVTLAAHLDKLAEEGRLPAGVERPSAGP